MSSRGKPRSRAAQRARHPGESRDPATTPLDSGVRRNDGMRLRCSIALAMCAAACIAAGLAHAQTYPFRTIRMVVPVAPGGSSDILGRVVGQRLSEQLNVAVVTDNRPGGSASVGSEVVAKAPADGYTLLTISVEFTINPSLR